MWCSKGIPAVGMVGVLVFGFGFGFAKVPVGIDMVTRLDELCICSCDNT